MRIWLRGIACVLLFTFGVALAQPVTLDWDAVTTYVDGSPLPNPTYLIERRQLPSPTFAEIVRNLTGITWQDTTVLGGQEYCYRAYARDAAGAQSGPSNEACSTVAALPPIGGATNPTLQFAQESTLVAEIQQVNYGSTGPLSTHTLTVTEPTQNNLLILAVVGDAVVNTPANWTKAVGAIFYVDIAIFYRIAPASFGTSMQFSLASSAEASAVFFEYSGMATTNVLDKTAFTDQGANTGTTATTAQADELLIGLIGISTTNQANNWSAWTNSFTEQADIPTTGTPVNVSLGVASRIVSATGTFSTAATAAAGVEPSGCIATFKAAAGGAGKASPALMAGPAAWCP